MPQNHTDKAKNIKDIVTSYDNFQEEVIMLEFDDTSLDELKKYAPMHPLRFDSLIFIGLSEGEMEIQVDYVTHLAGKNSITFIMPTHITYFSRWSGNLKGWILAISKSYIPTLSYPNRQQPVVISYMQLKKNPLTKFEPGEFQRLYKSFDFVRNKIRKQNHLFYKEIIKVALIMFFLDLGNLYLSKREHYVTPTLSRKEELFIDFQNLLRDNCKKQHDVKFYADKLCITTQYLSAILKEQSGKSTSLWIQEAIMIEAKGMLKTPRINIQQVSEELSFPDQSTFGKFFKKHAGISPLAFRKS